MTDYINTIFKVIQENSDQNLDIINKVDTFYNNAWNKIALVGSIAFGIVGIVVPFVIQSYQKRTLRLNSENLHNNLLKELTNELQALIETKFKENEQQLKSLNASSNAKILFSQAKFSVEKNSYKGALGEIVTASFLSIESNDYRTLQEMLEFILNDCLPYLSIEEINDLKTANICDFYHLLEELNKMDDRSLFKTKIGEIKVMISKLPPFISLKSSEYTKN